MSHNGNRDVWIARLDPDGQVIWCSYLGGSGIDGAYAVACLASGDAYIGGTTASSNLPVISAFQPTFGGYWDGFLARLTAGGQLTLCTYIGAGGEDVVTEIAVDSSGSACCVGYMGPGFIMPAGGFDTSHNGGNIDAFVLKVSPGGQPLYGTFLGGSGSIVGDGANGIAIDSAGNLVVTGATDSTNFPLRDAFDDTIGGKGDVFVACITADYSTLVWSSFLGGSGGLDETGYGIAVSGGAVVVTGCTGSADFPKTDGSTYKGGYEVFVTKIAKGQTPVQKTPERPDVSPIGSAFGRAGHLERGS